MTDERRYGGYGREERTGDDTARDDRRQDRRSGREDGDDDLFVWEDLRPPRRGVERAARAGRADSRSDHATTGSAASRRRVRAGYEVEEEWEEWLEPGGPYGPEASGSSSRRGSGSRRRRSSAGAVLAAMLLGFFLAGLLDAGGIEAEINAKPFGGMRSFQLALLKPMTSLSGLLRLDRPALALDRILARGEEEHRSLAEVGSAKKPLWPRKITAKKPLRLYVAGDSMNQVFGSSLVNLGGDTGLIKSKNDYHVSSGLSRPDFYDWPQRFVDQIVEFKPGAAAVLFGANDGQDVLYESKVLKVGTKAWQKVYAERVGEAMDLLSTDGRRVYWVGNPIMKDFGYRQRIAMMNHIYAAEAEKRPGVVFVSTWATMSDDKGSYAEYLKDENGDLVLIRAPDGIHLTRAGGDRMARLVLDVIEKDWGIAASPSSSPDAP